MKKLLALILALVTLFTCCTAAFAVTHYGNDSTPQRQEEGAFFLLNNYGAVVGAIRLDEFTSNLKNGSTPVALNVGYKTVTDILAEGKLLRCKNLKAVTLSDDKSSITAGESYVTATWEIKNQAVIDSLGITTLGELVEETKFSLDITIKNETKTFAGHRFLDKDAGSEVARIYVGKSYISVRYADWDDGIANNMVLCFRAGSKPYNGGNGNTSNPTQAPTVKPTQAPTQAPTAKPTTAPTTKPTTAPTTKPTTAPTTKPTTAPTTKPTQAPTQQPAATPNPQYQPVVTPPTLGGNSNNGSGGNSGSSNNNSGNSGNVPNPEYQQGTLPGGLGDFWN